MTLRLRLLLGYGYLVALLLLATGSAVLGFLHLSESVDVILEDNFSSITAAMRMLEALERQDSATLAALIEGRTEVPEMATHERDFLAALAAAEASATEEAEGPLIEGLRRDFQRYRQARDELLAAQPARALRAYNTRVFPAFSAAKGKVFQVLDLNYQAMVEADRATRRAAIQNGAWLGFLVAVALVSLVFLSRALQRRLLSRLADLRRGMGAIAAGEFHRRLRDDEADELGAIARHFNRLLDQLQQVEARMRGRLSQERQAVLGLVRHAGGGAAVYDLSGRLLAGADDELFGGRLPAELMDWIEEEGARRLEALDNGGAATDGGGGPAVVDVDETPMRIELLLASPTRAVGWLVRRDE
jgi:HAMP domain-containing protein